jgi:serine/threonine-protein kinase
VGRDRARTASEPAAECLSDDDIVALVAGQLSGTQRRSFADHIDVCERCRRLVSALAAAECATPSEPMAVRSDAGLRVGQVLGRFSLTRLLGHGSMGEVWAAHDQELDREVALKLLALRPGSSGSRRRFACGVKRRRWPA